MRPADSTVAEPSVGDVVGACVARVLGVDSAHLRRDTPLGPLGWDSLARVCLADALAEAGLTCASLGRAVTLGDVIDACHAPPGLGSA